MKNSPNENEGAEDTAREGATDAGEQLSGATAAVQEPESHSPEQDQGGESGTQNAADEATNEVEALHNAFNAFSTQPKAADGAASTAASEGAGEAGDAGSVKISPSDPRNGNSAPATASSSRSAGATGGKFPPKLSPKERAEVDSRTLVFTNLAVSVNRSNLIKLIETMSKGTVGADWIQAAYFRSVALKEKQESRQDTKVAVIHKEYAEGPDATKVGYVILRRQRKVSGESESPQETVPDVLEVAGSPGASGSPKPNGSAQAADSAEVAVSEPIGEKTTEEPETAAAAPVVTAAVTATEDSASHPSLLPASIIASLCRKSGQFILKGRHVFLYPGTQPHAELDQQRSIYVSRFPKDHSAEEIISALEQKGCKVTNLRLFFDGETKERKTFMIVELATKESAKPLYNKTLEGSGFSVMVEKCLPEKKARKRAEAREKRQGRPQERRAPSKGTNPPGNKKKAGEKTGGARADHPRPTKRAASQKAPQTASSKASGVPREPREKK